MFENFKLRIRSFFLMLKATANYLKSQCAYEIKSVSSCPKTGRHWIDVGIIGKRQKISCLAEEIAVDDNFLLGFSAPDIRTIVYLATCNKYEAILEENRIKKSYYLMRSKSINGKKMVRLQHKTSEKFMLVSLKSFASGELIEKLESQDAYNLGFLAGQEQTMKNVFKLRLIATSNDFPKN